MARSSGTGGHHMGVEESSPPVSVVIPARKAADSLPVTLDSVRAQDYPNLLEIIVAAADPETAAAANGVVVVDNASGTTPAGLNAAVAASRGEIVVRCDAHAVLPPGYVTRAVSTLLRTGADNVGGMQVPVGSDFVSRSIAGAMSSPVGSGDARYRVGGAEGPVETVYLGVYRRSALDAAGGFDERFDRNQDYELNHRIREKGGIVWFDPELRVEYEPRGSLGRLARQYFDYGRWKRVFSRRHPGSLRWRQLAPPLLVVALALSLVGAVWLPALLLVPAAYLLMLAVGAVIEAPRVGWAAVGLPLAWMVMHICWGAGYLIGLGDG